MDFTTVWVEHGDGVETIAGERRTDRRYDLRLELRWKLVRRRRVLDTGTGRTLDVSSGGILFDAGRTLPEGLTVEVSVAWPVLLHNAAPLRLVASGRIVRSDGTRCAMRMIQHEFRTAGVQPPAGGLAVARPRVPLPNAQRLPILGKVVNCRFTAPPARYRCGRNRFL